MNVQLQRFLVALGVVSSIGGSGLSKPEMKSLLDTATP